MAQALMWVSTSKGDDLDLFVVVHKLAATGDEVFFYGFNGFAKDAMAKGWLRASHREMDPRSQPSGSAVALASSTSADDVQRNRTRGNYTGG